MKLAGQYNLPDYDVVSYTKRGVSLTGKLSWDDNTKQVLCTANNYPALKLYGIVSYEDIAQTGKRVTQFLVEKKHLKSKRELPFDPLKYPG